MLDARPEDIEYWKFRSPVVRLDKALYGHPGSGTMWEKHCDTKVRESDFIPVGEEWPSMYYRPKLQLMLVIFDDLKAENLAKGWEMLRTKLGIEPETDLGLYLISILSKGEAHSSHVWRKEGENFGLQHGRFIPVVSWEIFGNHSQRYEAHEGVNSKFTPGESVPCTSSREEMCRIF